jgi:hypothetical protein
MTTAKRDASTQDASLHRETSERPPTSYSSHGSENIDEEKQAAIDDMAAAKPVQSSTESIYPGRGQTVAVMVSLVLAIFLVALVNMRHCIPKTANRCVRIESSSPLLFRK